MSDALNSIHSSFLHLSLAFEKKEFFFFRFCVILINFFSNDVDFHCKIPKIMFY